MGTLRDFVDYVKTMAAPESTAADASPADVPAAAGMDQLVQLATGSADPLFKTEWMDCFQAALQGTTGRTDMTDKQKVDLARRIADRSVSHLLHRHRLADVRDCCVEKATDDSMRQEFLALISWNTTWGKSYLSALQSTSGSAKDADAAVHRAQGIADVAMLSVFAGAELSIWKSCAKAHP